MRRLLLVCGALLLALPALADDDESEQLGLLFDTKEKVVTATRSERTVRDAPAVVSVMTFDQARRRRSKGGWCCPRPARFRARTFR